LGARTEEDFEVDTGKLLHPASLLAVEYFSRSKVLKVLVVQEHLHLVYSAFAVSSPVFEGVDDREKFLVVDFVVDFHGGELPRMEGDWVQAVLLVSLGEDCSEGEVRCVCLNNYWLLDVEVCQDWGSHESVLQLLKCKLGLGRPSSVSGVNIRELHE